jgi:predicted aldo/keto reductase-like oxidoreductase
VQYRIFGKTGIKLSALGFGAMRLPESDEDAIATIQRSFELGVNYLDTARIYPDSERKCGLALKGWRDKVYVSTKNNLEDTTAEGWWKRLNTSLELLDTDYIDFYQVIHDIKYPAYEEFKKGGGMDAVRKAKDEGLIKHCCFSTHESVENNMKLIDSGEFEGLTIQYNLLDRANAEVIAHAHESGMGVIIMGPVGGGRLAAPSETIQKLIDGPVASSAEVALRFVLANPNVTCAISGMRSVGEVEENCATASRVDPLSDEEKVAIEMSMDENKRLADLYCTGCGYCMPCPHGVNIPVNFHIMNSHRIYGLLDYAQRRYNRLSKPAHPERGKQAAECVECGECEPKCPQKIKIIAQLKEVAETFKSD